MKRFLFFVIIAIISIQVNAEEHGKKRYISTIGSNSNSGVDTANAWRTLGYAVPKLRCGDTLFVMGGYYTHDGLDTTLEANRNQCAFAASGKSDSVIVIKAYGVNGDDGGKAHFWGTGSSSYPRVLVNFGAYDHIVIDGWSYTSPTDSLFLVFDGIVGGGWRLSTETRRVDYCTTNRIFDLSDSDSCKITGVEVNGNHPPDTTVWNDVSSTGLEGYSRSNVTSGGPIRYGIMSTNATSDTVSSCYFHHMLYPSGNRGAGDGSSKDQGTGEAMFLSTGCRRWYIANNTLENANHAIISLEHTRETKILNNKIANEWGGGVYILWSDSRYNLIDGNIIIHSGESTTHYKNPIGIGAPSNVVRRNVVWAPDYYGNAGIEIKIQSTRKADSCLVYNNTIFDSDHGSFSYLNSGSSYTIWNGTIANNIFYKSKSLSTDAGKSASEIQCFLYYSPLAVDWSSDNGCLDPETTHFGWNTFKNNCIMKDSSTARVPNPRLIEFTDPSTNLGGCGKTAGWSLSSVQVRDSIAWHNNMEKDPKLKSENPSANQYGDWWHILYDSPCKDSGTVIADWIGALVDSSNYGYGWASLVPSGDSMDIGAYEYPYIAPDSNICEAHVTPQYMNFSNVYLNDTRSMTAYVINTCTDRLYPVLYNMADSTVFTLSYPAPHAFANPDTVGASTTQSLLITFAPTVKGAYADTLLVASGQDTIFMVGYGVETASGGSVKKSIIKD